MTLGRSGERKTRQQVGGSTNQVNLHVNGFNRVEGLRVQWKVNLNEDEVTNSEKTRKCELVCFASVHVGIEKP